jgi:hypothetical protein
MSAHSFRFTKAIVGTNAAIAAVMMAACASTHSSSPRQVDASNPTVTYQYRNDDELIQANQRAIAFCEPHQSLPRAQRFTDDTEHHRIVVFECVSNLQVTTIRQPDSELRYNYRTDQELLDVSRNAQVHCRNSGKPDMSSDVAVNSDGSRTVTFHCNPRYASN